MRLDSEGLRTSFDRWIATVAGVVAEGADAVAKSRALTIVGERGGLYRIAGESRAMKLENGEFLLEDDAPAAPLLQGARIRLNLSPDMFLFRDLDFPSKAMDFLDGVLRAQIDRLTPWSPAQAAFGHSPPVNAGLDRIKLVMAAAPLAQIQPIVSALGAAGANAVTVAARPEQGDLLAPIMVHEAAFRRERAASGAQGLLRKALVAALAFAGLSAAASGVAGAWLETRSEDIAAETHQWRQAQMAGARDPDVMLHKRKYDTPLTVLVIEQLARILPDDTYLRDVQFFEGKVEISGVSADATKLIAMLEASPTFSRATFSAPTTHAPNEPGDQFHIQAKVNPRYGLGE